MIVIEEEDLVLLTTYSKDRGSVRVASYYTPHSSSSLSEPLMHARSKSSNSFFSNKLTRKSRSSCAVFAKIATKKLALVVNFPDLQCAPKFWPPTAHRNGNNRQPLYFQQFRLIMSGLPEKL